MKKYIPIVNELEGREWCRENGYKYCGTRLHSELGFIMEYDDSMPNILSDAAVEYYRQEDEAKREIWVIASDDGVHSRLYYTGNKERPYNYELSEAKRYTKAYAQRKAKMMTEHTKIGREWYAFKV